MRSFTTCFLVLCLRVFSIENTGFSKGGQSQKSHAGCGPWDPKTVTVSQGTVKGLTMYTKTGRPFCSFRAIPFSQPPVGQYRFQPPRDPKPWEGVLDATSEMPQCLMFLSELGVFGVEDCLYLSVFTPTLKPPSGKLLDVMVWITPGAYFFGFTMTIALGPHYLIDKDVVIVYVNARLGVFGYLSTGDDEAPGNYGLKDQVAALRWVKNNIAAFGGNPNSVTVYGVSSGSSSAQLHMLSPLTKGLIHRAISLGGSGINPWSRTVDPLQQAKKQALFVGCPTDSNSKLVSCLREVDAVKLTSSFKYFIEWFSLLSGYAPVVENKTERNPNPFLCEHPVEVMRTGNFERIPWLVGGNAQDTAFAITALFKVLALRVQANQLISHNYLHKFLLMDVSSPPEIVLDVTSKVADFYMGPDHRLTDDNMIQVMNMFSDRYFIHGEHKSVQLLSLTGNQTIYKYNLAYKALYTDNIFPSLNNYGTSHGDELQFIFEFGYGLLDQLHEDDREVRDVFVTFLANFAKYGNPTPGIPSGNYLVDEFKWLPVGQTTVDNMHLRYLNIGQVRIPGLRADYLNQGLGPVRLQMAVDLYKERMDLWDSLPLNENCPYNCNGQTGERVNEENSGEKTKCGSQNTLIFVFASTFVVLNAEGYIYS